MKNKKRMILIGSILIAPLMVTVGVTYAFYTYRGQGQRENMVKTGNLTFVYDEQRAEGNQVTPIQHVIEESVMAMN